MKQIWHTPAGFARWGIAPIPNIKHSMRTLFISLALLFSMSSSLAAPDRPTIGAYGFNWSKQKAKCRQVTAEQLKIFTSCNRDNPGFGEHKPTHACRVNNGDEWIIYQTLAQCEDELGMMKANSP